MCMFDYPGMEFHQKEHRHFFAKLDNIEHSSLKKLDEAKMVQLLQDWLIMHMHDSDRDYAKHIFSGVQVVRSSGDPS